MRNRGFMRCFKTALSVKGQIQDLEGRLTQHYAVGSKSNSECCRHAHLYGFVRTEDRSTGLGVQSQVEKPWLQAKVPVPDIGTQLVSLHGCVLCCDGGLAHLEVA